MNSRKVALEILLDINQGGYSNLVLDKYLKQIEDSRDRALITEIVYGVLRLRNRLDYIIKQFSRIPLEKMDKLVLIALRIGIYQLECLDKIPARAAVNETVKAVKGKINKGAVGFVNGLLRNVIRRKDKIAFPSKYHDPISYLVNYLSYPVWLAEYWINIYGVEQALQLCGYFNQAAPLTIRINTLKYSIEEFLRVYQQEEIELIPTAVPQSYIVAENRGVASLPLFQEGGFIVQGPAATLTAHLLNPEPGMKILDMAAAPGGKTTHLAELMNNHGEIIALDIHQHKLQLIEKNCRRLGIENVKIVNSDNKEYQSVELYDMILLDAPCSGLGLIGHKPEIRWNKDCADIKRLAELQLSMLQNAVKLLKNGGILMYSTCTLTAEENQENVRKIMDLTDNKLKLLNLNDDLKRLALENCFEVDQTGFLELFPPVSETEGFFIAKFQKI